MRESGTAYVLHGKLFLQRWSDPGAWLHRWAEPTKWKPDSKSSPQSVDRFHRLPAYKQDIYSGFALGVSVNPLASADYVTGRGQGHAANPHLALRNFWRFDRRSQHACAEAVRYEATEHLKTFRERGTSGELINSVFATTATPAFALGNGFGWMVGAPLWIALGAGYCLGIRRSCPSFFNLTAVSGQVIGSVLALLAGVAAAAAPWLAVATARLVAALWEVGCGSAFALAFAIYALRHLRGTRPPATVPLYPGPDDPSLPPSRPWFSPSYV